MRGVRYRKIPWPQRKLTRSEAIIRLVYCPQAIATNRNEIVSEADMEECLTTIVSKGSSVGREFRYGTVEMGFFHQRGSGFAYHKNSEKRESEPNVHI